MTKKEWSKFIELIQTKKNISSIVFKTYDGHYERIYSRNYKYGEPYVNGFGNVIDPCTYQDCFNDPNAFKLINEDTLVIEGSKSLYHAHNITIDGTTYTGHKTTFKDTTYTLNRKKLQICRVEY